MRNTGYRPFRSRYVSYTITILSNFSCISIYDGYHTQKTLRETSIAHLWIIVAGKKIICDREFRSCDRTKHVSEYISDTLKAHHVKVKCPSYL